MRIITTSYIEQKTKLPKIGRYIVAHFDEEGVILYQGCPQSGKRKAQALPTVKLVCLE